jgi:Contractile injection system tape measure protein
MKLLPLILLFLFSYQINSQEKPVKTPIPISNAGIVILQSFFTPYFQRLGLLEGQQFKNEKQRRDAAHFLQFLATGATETEEQHLLLNKIILGLDINHPIETKINMSNADKEIAESLLNASIHHWNAISQSSLVGFRGNWLIREGLLIETEQHWELTVQKRAYDLLLSKAPFSYSVIKFRWMKKPLYVTWEA